MSSGLTLTTTSTGPLRDGQGPLGGRQRTALERALLLAMRIEEHDRDGRPRSEASENRCPVWSRRVSIAGAGRAPAAQVASPCIPSVCDTVAGAVPAVTGRAAGESRIPRRNTEDDGNQ